MRWPAPLILLATTLAMVGCDRDPPSGTPATAPVGAAIADDRTYLAGFVRDATVAWPKNRTLTIVCHGHSVPAGYFVTPEVRTFDAYPHLLHVELKKRFPNAVINVIVTAISGENALPGNARFERDVLSLRPDVVLIDYALNDRAAGLTLAHQAWDAMILKAKAAGVRVILLTPTPDRRADLNDPNDPLHQHAVQIRNLAAKHGVGLVDSLQAFQDAVAGGTPMQSLMSQYNHPNRAGHDLVAARIARWFRAAPED